MPGRVVMSRTSAWRWHSPDAVIVDRRTKWGNPFRLHDKSHGLVRTPAALEPGRPWEYEGRISADGMLHPYVRADGSTVRCEVAWMTAAQAVELFARCLVGDLPPSVLHAFGRNPVQVTVADVRRELAGRDLACWCSWGRPCHADVLLKVAAGLPAALPSDEGGPR
jgi:hypothetical protein